MIELVVFDMMGTTVQDAGQVPRALVAALAEPGIEITAEVLTDVRGSSKRQAVCQLVPAGPDHQRISDLVYDCFRRLLIDLYAQESVAPEAGAERIFHELRRRNIRVALNTGFDRQATQSLLAALQWDRRTVDAVICGDDVSQGRPAPRLIYHAMDATGVNSPRHVVNVGDTVRDLQAGHNAGVGWNVGVLSGAHSRERLLAAPHTHLLPSIRELSDLLEADR